MPRKSQIVATTAGQLRSRILACPPGAQIGALPDIARAFGVGIVTVQQAARILEQEGFLSVRRGPNGGYFGRRPDVETLERQLAAYLQSDPASDREMRDMTSLLFNELCAAAAGCCDDGHHEALRAHAAAIAACRDPAQIGTLESQLQALLFAMVNRPLFELITRVVLQLATARGAGKGEGFGVQDWRESRQFIIDAILRKDPELARFEADRRNRRHVMALAPVRS